MGENPDVEPFAWRHGIADGAVRLDAMDRDVAVYRLSLGDRSNLNGDLWRIFGRSPGSIPDRRIANSSEALVSPSRHTTLFLVSPLGTRAGVALSLRHQST